MNKTFFNKLVELIEFSFTTSHSFEVDGHLYQVYWDSGAEEIAAVAYDESNDPFAILSVPEYNRLTDAEKE